jgi:hypothetical protein
MEREVDRLLAQLAHVGTPESRGPAGPHVGTPARYPAAPARSASVAPSTGSSTRGALFALWARMLLGITLGAVMTQWPYPHSCGWPLVGYLGAVVTVIISGAWIGFASWKLRSGLVHILSLVLIFWGIVLAAEQLLPRIGYASDRASWACAPEGRSP